MELLERPGKAVGRIVAVFQRHIDDPGVAVGQLLGSQGEAAAPSIATVRTICFWRPACRRD